MFDTKQTGPKDVFVQLLLMVALYLSATHLGALLFQIVNTYLPDAVHGRWYGPDAMAASIRWSIAMLIVTAPVFFGVTWHLRKEFARAPEKLGLRSRRWLTALTLFAAALIAIGDLVTVVHTFLGGELTARFLLKALIVLVIAGAVFWYERWEFRREQGGRPPNSILALRWGAIVVTAAAIVVGFMASGSPWSARRMRFDAERIRDLQQLQGRIVEHWQRTRALPASIDALRDEIRDYTPQRDPETDQPYEYRAVGDLQFELCATFRTNSTTQPKAKAPRQAGRPDTAYDASFENWMHGVGRTCFTRTIDPDRYPPRKPLPLPPPPVPMPIE